MSKVEIGLNAGRVWQVLSDNARWSYNTLKKKLGMRDAELSAAIGLAGPRG